MSTISRFDACLAAASAMVLEAGGDTSDTMETLSDHFDPGEAEVSYSVVKGKPTFTISFPSDTVIEDEDEDE